jgi:opacity protein-like surface antigen
MLRALILIGTVLAAGTTADAAEPRPSGFYAGGSIGTSVFEDDGMFFGLTFDDTDTSFQGHLGYKFFRYFAVESRYTDYGTFTVETTAFEATAVSVHAVGIIPFGQSGWEMFGQFGVGSVKIEVAGTDDTQTSFAGGLGVQYYPTQSLSIGVRTDVHVWTDDTLGFSLTPGVGATQLTVQLAF